LGEHFFQLLAVIDDGSWAPVGEDVRVAMGKYNDVPRTKIDRMRAVLNLASGSSIRDQVKDDDVLGSLAEKGCDFARGRGAKAPRRGELGVEEHRTFKLHRLEDFGKSIHQNSMPDSRLKFQDSQANVSTCYRETVNFTRRTDKPAYTRPAIVVGSTHPKQGGEVQMSSAAQLPVLDMDKLNAFIGQFVTDLGASVHAGMVVIGEKLGLYKALTAGPMDSAELAAKTQTDERYLREWLASQAAGGYITYDE